MQEVVISRAGSEELASILGLQRRFYVEDGIRVSESVRREALGGLLSRADIGAVWLAKIGSTAIGYIVLCYGYSLELGGRDAFIDEVYVAADQRAQGVGTALLDHAIQGGEEAGVRAFHLEVAEAKPAALSIYRKRGFQKRNYRLMTRVSSR